MLVIEEILGQYSFIFSVNPFLLANDVAPGDGKGLVVVTCENLDSLFYLEE